MTVSIRETALKTSNFSFLSGSEIGSLPNFPQVTIPAHWKIMTCHQCTQSPRREVYQLRWHHNIIMITDVTTNCNQKTRSRSIEACKSAKLGHDYSIKVEYQRLGNFLEAFNLWLSSVLLLKIRLQRAFQTNCTKDTSERTNGIVVIARQKCYCLEQKLPTTVI